MYHSRYVQCDLFQTAYSGVHIFNIWNKYNSALKDTLKYATQGMYVVSIFGEQLIVVYLDLTKST